MMRISLLIGALVLLLQTSAQSQWELLEAPTPNSTVTKLEKSGDILYALAGNMYYSENRGTTWNKIDCPFASPFAYSPGQVDFTATDNFLVLTYQDSVLATTDNGASWTSITPPDFFSGTPSHEGDTLYLQNGRTLYKSTDHGATWLTFALPYIAEHDLADVSIYRGTMYGLNITETGIYIIHPGAGYELVDLPGRNPRCYNYFFEGDTLFVSIQYGIYYRNPADLQWKLANAPIATSPFTATKKNGNTFAVTTYHSDFYAWDDATRTWEYHPLNVILPESTFSELEISLIDDPYIYITVQYQGIYRLSTVDYSGELISAGMNDGMTKKFSVCSEGLIGLTSTLYMTTDLGLSWEERSPPLMSSWVNDVASEGSRIIAFTGNDTLRISDDAGRTWSSALLPDTFCTYGNYTGMAILQSATFLSSLRGGGATGGIIRTTNDGATWEVLSTPSKKCHWIKAIDGILFAGFDNAVYRTADNGQRWEGVYTSEGSSPVYDFGADGDVYVVSDLGRLMHSTDAGIGWEQLTISFNHYQLGILFVDHHLFAYNENGIHMMDEQLEWTNITGDFSRINPRTLTRHNDHLFISTLAYGSYRRPLNQIIVNVEKPAEVEGFRILSAYPNPAQSHANITYWLSEAAPITIDVYDMLGKRRLHYSPGRQEPGEHNQFLQTSALQPGMYHVVVRINSLTGSTLLVIR